MRELLEIVFGLLLMALLSICGMLFVVVLYTALLAIPVLIIVYALKAFGL